MHAVYEPPLWITQETSRANPDFHHGLLEADDPDQPSFTRRRKSCASICTFLAMSGSWSFSNMISLAAISAASLGLKPRITSPSARLMKLSGARDAGR